MSRTHLRMFWNAMNIAIFLFLAINTENFKNIPFSSFHLVCLLTIVSALWITRRIQILELHWFDCRTGQEDDVSTPSFDCVFHCLQRICLLVLTKMHFDYDRNSFLLRLWHKRLSASTLTEMYFYFDLDKNTFLLLLRHKCLLLRHKGHPFRLWQEKYPIQLEHSFKPFFSKFPILSWCPYPMLVKFMYVNIIWMKMQSEKSLGCNTP